MKECKRLVVFLLIIFIQMDLAYGQKLSRKQQIKRANQLLEELKNLEPKLKKLDKEFATLRPQLSSLDFAKDIGLRASLISVRQELNKENIQDGKEHIAEVLFARKELSESLIKSILQICKKHFIRFQNFSVMAKDVIAFEESQKNKKDFASWGMKTIGADVAWESTDFTRTITVAIIDDEFHPDHPDLKKIVWKPTENQNQIPKEEFPSGQTTHGTMMAGIIGASHNNKGIAGVAKNVRLMMLPSSMGRAEALKYAIQNGANIISISMQWQEDPEIELLVNLAAEKNILIVNSAGNDKSNRDEDPTYPGSYNSANILMVMAVSKEGQPWETAEPGLGSSYGKSSVHLAAPGVEIISTRKNNTYSFDGNTSGTSQATAFVSGAAALVWSHNKYKDLSCVELKELLLKNVKKYDSLKDKSISGGVLDVSFLGASQRKND